MGVLFLGEDCSSALSTPQVPAVLGVPPVRATTSTGVGLVQLVFKQSCWGNFMGVNFDNTRRHNLTENSLFFWL